MNIVILGAGAIGSLFGALLSKHHNVLLLGRKPHVSTIQSNGLHIQGKTVFHEKISATDTVKNVSFDVDLLLLTVKSYDTIKAIKQAKPIISKNTIVLTFQNGLDNIEKLQSVISKNQILAGITTHGAVFKSPGVVHHTGIGRTIIGELDGAETKRLKNIVELFDEANIPVKISYDILKDIWQKAIINSSINPLTAIFQCKNGYLMENPILFHLVSYLCEESTNVAKSMGYAFTTKYLFEQTIQVINETFNNNSSMLQSVERKSQTEIDSINGKIVTFGRKNNISVLLNEAVCFIIKQLYS